MKNGQYRYEYFKSWEVASKNYPFYALLMAAMLQADTDNTAKFKAAWPDVWNELAARYHVLGGLLEDEQ